MSGYLKNTTLYKLCVEYLIITSTKKKKKKKIRNKYITNVNMNVK